MKRSCVLLAVFLSPMLLVMLVAASTPPDVFSDQSFAQAKAASVKQGKLLIVDATAVWCQPCKLMDKTTWIDSKVVSWIDQQALAIQVDVDKESKVAKALRIEAMPTVIVFKDGEEYDRVVGYRDAKQLLQWLTDLGQGRRAIDSIREAAGDRNKPGADVDIQARLELARALVSNNELDEAAEEFAWLWDNMLIHQPSMVGVRLSFMVSDMRRLAESHPPAAAVFTKLRDGYQSKINKGSASRKSVSDWVHLNSVIGDDEATLKWYDKNKDQQRMRESVEYIRGEVFELLIERDRWSDAGEVLRDPVGLAKQSQRRLEMREFPASIPAQQLASIKAMMRKGFTSDLSQYYGACLAAGREKSAKKVAQILIEEQGSAEAHFALIETALWAQQARPQHLKWLDEADEAGEGNRPLRVRVKEALRAQAAKSKSDEDTKPPA